MRDQSSFQALFTEPAGSYWLLRDDTPEIFDSSNLPDQPLPRWALDGEPARVEFHRLLASHPNPAEHYPVSAHAEVRASIGRSAHSERTPLSRQRTDMPTDGEEHLVPQLERILRQLLHNQEAADRRQEHAEAQLTFLIDELRRLWRGGRGRRGRSTSRRIQPIPQSPSRSDLSDWELNLHSKDSTGNYTRRCIRKHVGLTFGFSPDGRILAPPSDDFKNNVLLTINRGGPVQKPFVYDWNSPPSTLYNLCIEGAFSADFWTSVEDGLYDLAQIPPKYQERGRFIRSLRTYLTHIKQMLRLASQPRTEQAAFKKRCTKNSRKTTTFHNRRNAASYIQNSQIGARVHDLISAVGTEGISSDEEGEVSQRRRGRAREYLVFDKPWRSKHLVEIYRWLDGKHAETRNIHGAPIRVRRLRPGFTRESTVVPKGLPVDCYDSTYLQSLSGVQRRVLGPGLAVDMEELWLGILSSELTPGGG